MHVSPRLSHRATLSQCTIIIFGWLQSKFVKVPKGADVVDGNFVWKEARFIFVVVFSHATVTLSVKEGAFGMPGGKGAMHATIKVAELKQGVKDHTLELRHEGSEVRACAHGHLPLSLTPAARERLAANQCNRS